MVARHALASGTLVAGWLAASASSMAWASPGSGDGTVVLTCRASSAALARSDEGLLLSCVRQDDLVNPFGDDDLGFGRAPRVLHEWLGSVLVDPFSVPIVARAEFTPPDGAQRWRSK